MAIFGTAVPSVSVQTNYGWVYRPSPDTEMHKMYIYTLSDFFYIGHEYPPGHNQEITEGYKKKAPTRAGYVLAAGRNLYVGNLCPADEPPHLVIITLGAGAVIMLSAIPGADGVLHVVGRVIVRLDDQEHGP